MDVIYLFFSYFFREIKYIPCHISTRPSSVGTEQELSIHGSMFRRSKVSKECGHFIKRSKENCKNQNIIITISKIREINPHTFYQLLWYLLKKTNNLQFFLDDSIATGEVPKHWHH